MRNIYLKFLILFPLLIATERFCHYQTAGFALEKISSTLRPHPEWEIAPLSPQKIDEIRELLAQPFTYLGKGAQAYVFESQDKKYVLKFFRHSHIRPPFWVDLLPPLPLFQELVRKKRERAEGKLTRDFGSYKIAYEEFKDETGLYYLHLNKTRDLLHQTITFYDKIGIQHHVAADQMEFVLQKKAELLYPSLQRWIMTGEEQKAQSALSSLISLLKMRCEKGIWDKDPDLATNFGVVGERVIQIDVGRYRKDPSLKQPKVSREDILRSTDKLERYLEAHAPELGAYFKNALGQL